MVNAEEVFPLLYRLTAALKSSSRRGRCQASTAGVQLLFPADPTRADRALRPNAYWIFGAMPLQCAATIPMPVIARATVSNMAQYLARKRYVLFPARPPVRVYRLGDPPQTPASPALSGLGTPGESEGVVPSESFRGWAGRMYQSLMQPSTGGALDRLASCEEGSRPAS